MVVYVLPSMLSISATMGQDTVPDLLKGRNNLGWWDVKAIPTQLWGVTVLDAGTPVCVVTSCAGGRICSRMALLHL